MEMKYFLLLFPALILNLTCVQSSLEHEESKILRAQLDLSQVKGEVGRHLAEKDETKPPAHCGESAVCFRC